MQPVLFWNQSKPVASYLRNGKDLSPPRLPLLQLLLLSLLHAAGVFLDRIASFES